jgi:hypothetical protein
MDTHLFQPEDPHLDELLDRVLATPPMRASLVDDIVARTAPMLADRKTRLLDDVLAPAEPSPLLTERILKATRPALYRKRHPVIGFLGCTPAYRAAAGVLLAAMLGIWVTLASIAADARQLSRIESQLANLSTLASSSDLSFDQEIGRLDAQLQNLQVSTAWDAARIVVQDDALWPLDGPVTDMPWLF